MQAAEGKFNPHIHVEYEWSLRLEEMDESDDDLDDKVRSEHCSVSFKLQFNQVVSAPLYSADESNNETIESVRCADTTEQCCSRA